MKKNKEGVMEETEVEVKEYYEDVEVEIEEEELDDKGKVVGKKKVKRVVKKKKFVV